MADLPVPAGLAFPVPSGESFRLDGGDEADKMRARTILFSQISDPLAVSRGPFALMRGGAVGSAAVQEAGIGIAPVDPQHAQTAQFDGPFLAGRDALRAAIADAPEAEQVARQLDYAQFLIAHAMLPEARGVVGELLARPDVLDAAARDRALGYAAIAARLGGGAPVALPAAWREDPLWPVVVEGQPVARDRVQKAVAALSGQSRAVATAALPLLFDAALAAGDVVTAADLLAAAPEGTDLDGTGLLDLMRGRLALAQGAGDMAFDTFARVAEGQDRAAAEARVALADMALARKDAAVLPQVRLLLQEGMPRWRGDDTALRLRVRLARVAEDMRDIPTAVEAMSSILHEHPATHEAELAEARIAVMIDRLAGDIAGEALPLGDAVATVRRLDGVLAGRGAWITARAALARRLTEAGLAEAAKAEYAAIALSPPEALGSADPAVLDEVATGHAALLLASGDKAAARAVLDRRSYPRDEGQMATFAALRLRAGHTSMLPDLLLAALRVKRADGIADPAAQLALGDVAVASGQQDAALAAYDRGVVMADEAQRLRASRVAGELADAARATRYAAGLEGPQAEARRAVVQGLAAPRRAGERLSVSGASALIDAAAEAGAAVDRLLSEVGDP